MFGWQADEEGVLHQVDPLRASELVAFGGGVLVADGDVELARQEAWFEGARRDLAEQDTQVAVRESQPGDRGRDEARQGRRERPEAQVLATLTGQGRDLRVGQLEAPRDVIGVFEQDLARACKAQAAAAALEQAKPDLGLQQGDLVRHGWL